MDAPHPLHLILPAGTRIVTRVEAAPIGGAAAVAPGGVAMIVSSPGDATHAYRVRFLDGTEAMLRRSEFSILKEFKTGALLGEEQGRDFAEWERFVIYRCVVGSVAFGLSGEKSDIDRRGIYLPPAELHWSLYGVPGQVENAPGQECYWELQKFSSWR